MTAEETDIAGTIKELSSRVKLKTLSNGLRVVMYRRGVAPVFSGYVGARVGGVDEVTGATGLSHMLEHMAFKGTEVVGTKDFAKEKPLLDELEGLMHKQDDGQKLSAEEVARVKDIYGQLKNLWVMGAFTNEYTARGGSGMNARTTKEATEYYVDLPRSQFEFWCWMESERILKPVMRQFYQERDVVREERRMRFDDPPGGKLYEMLLGTAYRVHPYRNPVIGYEADIAKLSAKAAAELHARYYVPSNIVVSVVGDVDPDKDIGVLEKYFGRISSATAPAAPSIVEPKQEGERDLEVKMRANPLTLVAYHKVQYPDKDDPAIGIMTHAFAGTNVSPLYQELVEKRKVVSEVSDEEAPGQMYPNLLIFGLAPRAPHNNKEALEAFDEVLEKFKQTGPSDEDIAVAKRALITSMLGSFKSNQSLATSLGGNELLFRRWDASLDWLEQSLKVSKEDVQRVAKVYLVKENRTVGRVESLKEVASGSH